MGYLLIDNRGSNNPYINLAIEEFVVNELPTDQHTYLHVYINEPCVVLGKNQVVLEETNWPFCQQESVKIARRISGGGTVFHDKGNVNFSYISNFDQSKLNNFEEFAAPIQHVLAQYNLGAQLSTRNDLLLDGLKISGTAQFTNRKKILTHGTLLFDSELDMLSLGLKTQHQIQSRSIKSVRSKVGNVGVRLNHAINIYQLIDQVIESRFGNQTVEKYEFNDTEWAAIEHLAEQKFSNWNWWFARCPTYVVQKSKAIGDTELSLDITIKKGKIDQVDVQKSPKGPSFMSAVLDSLVGIDYEPKSIALALQSFSLLDFEGFFTKKSFGEFIL